MVFNPRVSFLCFGGLLAIIPTGTAYAQYTQLGGIIFYDWFFFGFLATTLVSGRRSVGKMDYKAFAGMMFLAFFSIYFIYGLVANGFTKYYLKDFRPVIYILSFWILLKISNSSKSEISPSFAMILVVLFGAFNFLDSALLYFGLVSNEDQFYEDNSYRYLDAGTYASALFLILVFVDKKIISGKYSKALLACAILVSASCVLLSNSRFLLVALSLSLLFAVRKKIGLLLTMSTLVGLFGAAFLMVSQEVGAQRVIDGLTYDGILFQLNTRFSPAIVSIQSMSFWEVIFGYGPGYFFEIPWFHYRDIDIYNSNIDSTYLTLYVKYGFASLVVIYYFLNGVMYKGNSDANKVTSIFLLIMFIVSALPYQPYTIGVPYLLALMNMVRKNTEKV